MKRALARIIMGAGLSVAIAATLYVPLSGHSVWTLGDVFVGVGSGNFQVLSNVGAIVDTNLAAGDTGATGGCGLDPSLNAYLVNTTQQKIFRYSPAQETTGPQPRPHVLLGTIATDSNPESIAFAPNGDFFVGHLGGLIRRYSKNSSGVYVQQPNPHQAMIVDTSDSFSIDIAADGTIFYTSGGLNIRRVTFDGSAFGSDTLFTTLPQQTSPKARALRVLPPTTGGGNAAVLSGLIVAAQSNVKWVNASGAVIGEYDTSGNQSQNDWFAIALDPRDVDEAGGDLSFWAGDKSSGQLWKFNVQSGFNTTAAPQSGPFQTAGVGTLRGACVNGEPTTGQYTVVLKFDDANDFKATATFAAGTQDEHSFGIQLDCAVAPSLCASASTVTAVVNAREVISDGVCSGPNSETNTSDVDCGFKKYFTFRPPTVTDPSPPTDPLPPIGARYVHGRAVYYHVKSWAANGNAIVPKPKVFVTISSESQLSVVTAALPDCSVTTPRALRIFRDSSDTGEDQFAEDLTDFLGVDEWVIGGRANRFMAAGRCATGSSAFKAPAQNRTFRAGNSIPIDLILKDAAGNPVTNATTAPHSIATTIGFNGGITFCLGSPNCQVGPPGNSPDFWRQVQPGKYSANLDTTGLPPSLLPYNLCVSDRIEPDPLDPSVALQQPEYQHLCLTFFLK